MYLDEFRPPAVRLLREWQEARGIEAGSPPAVCRQLDLNFETLGRWYIEAEGSDASRARPAATSRTGI